jgi:adenine phosphoribosyltransferase
MPSAKNAKTPKPTTKAAAGASKTSRTSKASNAGDSSAPPKRDARTIAPPPPMIARPMDSFAYARSLIRDVPDFPKKGILFKDITTLLAVPRAFHVVLDGIAERFIGEHIDAIVGIEARGFIFGGALAARLNASFVPARKPGKLPAAVDRIQVITEYSTTELEIHKGSFKEEARVVVVDDVLATGGTARAAGELVRMQGGYVIGFAFVVEIAELGGREKLLPVRVESCITY